MQQKSTEIIPAFMWELPRHMQEKIVKCRCEIENKEGKERNVRVYYTDLMNKKKEKKKCTCWTFQSGTNILEIKNKLELNAKTRLVYNGEDIVDEDWKLPSSHPEGFLFSIPTFVMPSSSGFINMKKMKKKSKKNHNQQNLKIEKPLEDCKTTKESCSSSPTSFQRKYQKWNDAKTKVFSEKARQMKQLRTTKS